MKFKKIKNILRDTEKQMNKFHQEILGRNRRLPELADRKSKGQRAVENRKPETMV